MTKTAAQFFKDHLLQGIASLQALLDVLRTEQQCLEKGPENTEKLESLTQQKQTLLEKIQADVDGRKRFLLDQGLTDDLAGVEAFIQSQSPGVATALGKGWKQLVDLMEKVHEQNLINGRLVNRAMQHFDLMLASLQHAPGEGKVKVYQPSGGSGVNLPRDLGKA